MWGHRGGCSVPPAAGTQRPAGRDPGLPRRRLPPSSASPAGRGCGERGSRLLQAGRGGGPCPAPPSPDSPPAAGAGPAARGRRPPGRAVWGRAGRTALAAGAACRRHRAPRGRRPAPSHCRPRPPAGRGHPRRRAGGWGATGRVRQCRDPPPDPQLPAPLLTARGLSRAPSSSSTSAGGRDALVRRKRSKVSSSLSRSRSGRVGGAVLCAPRPLSAGRSWARRCGSCCPSAWSATPRASASRRERLRARSGGVTVSGAPSPALTRARPPPAPRSHGAVEVAHHAGGLPGSGVLEAGVVHVADDALQPGQGPRRRQRLVGEVTCGTRGGGSGCPQTPRTQKGGEPPAPIRRLLPVPPGDAHTGAAGRAGGTGAPRSG